MRVGVALNLGRPIDAIVEQLRGLSAGDDDIHGVDTQERFCRKLCAERGWSVAPDAVYVDDDISGSKRLVRKDFQRLSAAIEAGAVDVLVCVDFDRLTRHHLEGAILLDLCERSPIHQLAYSDEPDRGVNFDTGDGIEEARDKLNAAAKEARTKGKRMARKHEALADEGRFHGGSTPFGTPTTVRPKSQRWCRPRPSTSKMRRGPCSLATRLAAS